MLAGSRYFDEDENKTAGLRPGARSRRDTCRTFSLLGHASASIKTRPESGRLAGVRSGRTHSRMHMACLVLIHRTSLARAWHCGEPLHRRLAYGSWRNHAECTLRGAKCTRWGLIRRRPDRENSTTRRRRTVMRRRTLPPCLRVPSPCRPTGVRDRIPLPRAPTAAGFTSFDRFLSSHRVAGPGTWSCAGSIASPKE